MKGRAIAYTAEELAWIEARSTLPRATLHAGFVAQFGRPEITKAAIGALCKRRGWTTGRDGRFPAGHTPVNKGRKGECAPGSEKTWFRKGNRTGRANHVYQPVGAERMGKSGYLERKINDDMPFHRRWRAVHLIEWEAAHGPIPAGHCLKCLDGDRTNTAPDNWIAVPRALLPRLTGRWQSVPYDTAPPELKPLLLTIARLEHAAGDRRAS
jgi:hypothetical protein